MGLWSIKVTICFALVLLGAFPNAYLTPKEQITAATALISSHHDIKHRVRWNTCIYSKKNFFFAQTNSKYELHNLPDYNKSILTFNLGAQTGHTLTLECGYPSWQASHIPFSLLLFVCASR